MAFDPVSASTNAIPTEVVLHPLCLLSVTDHYNRVAKDTKKRVVGVLLGSKNGNLVDVTNSYGVPFEEDLKDPDVWFLDHNFLETMFWMFKKVNTREDIVGFYSTGPKLKENDLKISSLIKQFCTVTQEPVFIIIDIRPGISGLPTTAYEAVEEVVSHGKEFQRVFKHIPCSIGAEEAEEVGVEHLLRDINDPSTSSLALQISEKISGLTGLAKRLTEIKEYLDRVTRPEGDPQKLPVNNQIIYNLQNILNLLPNLNVEELVKSMQVKTNDMHLVMYLSSLIRSVIALHSLLQNKIKFADMDEKIEADDEKNAKRDKEKKEVEKEGEEKVESQ